MSIQATHQLEESANLAGHERLWALQRAAWLLMALVLLLALAGLFGSGPLGKATAAAGNGALRVDYPRFWRVKSPVMLQVHVRPEPGGEVHVWLDRAYLADARLERVVPEPSRVEVSGERLTFTFASAGTGTVQLNFHVEFESPGMVRARIGSSANAVGLRQFIYP